MTSRKKTYDVEQGRAWERLAEALGERLGLPEGPNGRTIRAVTSWVAQNLWGRYYYAEQPSCVDQRALRAGVDDALDALRLIPGARHAVDLDERTLIQAARQMGATWEQIGVALGAAEAGARQTARGRFSRLGGDPNGTRPGAAIAPAPHLVEAPPAPPAPAARVTRHGEVRRFDMIERPARDSAPAVVFEAPALLDVDQGGPR